MRIVIDLDVLFRKGMTSMQSYEILESKEYGKFHFVKGNRKVVRKRVDALKSAISRRNLLSSYPIVVDRNFGILDGQHRFTAASELGVAIHYVIDKTMTLDDVASTSALQVGWKHRDYLDHFVSLGYAEYIKLSKFMTQHPWMNFQDATGLCHYGDVARRNSGRFFEEGEYTANCTGFAAEVADRALGFKAFGFKHYRNTIFISTLRNLASNKHYDHDRMIRKMKLVPGRLLRSSDVVGYMVMLDEIYNFKSKEADRFNLRKISPGSKDFVAPVLDDGYAYV